MKRVFLVILPLILSSCIYGMESNNELRYAKEEIKGACSILEINKRIKKEKYAERERAYELRHGKLKSLAAYAAQLYVGQKNTKSKNSRTSYFFVCNICGVEIKDTSNFRRHLREVEKLSKEDIQVLQKACKKPSAL